MIEIERDENLGFWGGGDLGREDPEMDGGLGGLEFGAADVIGNSRGGVGDADGLGS
jgi:hypothetical protein